MVLVVRQIQDTLDFPKVETPIMGDFAHSYMYTPFVPHYERHFPFGKVQSEES